MRLPTGVALAGSARQSAISPHKRSKNGFGATQPGGLRASLNHYGYIPQMAEQTKELASNRLAMPMLAWGGRRSFGNHCFDCAKAIAKTAEGGVIEECGHWVFEEQPDFITDQLIQFWSGHG